MLRRTFLAIPLVLAALSSLPAAEPLPLRVLFIGNSYTYGNDLPKMIDELSKAGKQRPLEIGRELRGGYSLQKHWMEGKAAKMLGDKKWDLVVLQDHSLGPIKERKQLGEAAAKFDEQIQKQGAKTLFFQTWARQDQPDNQAVLTKAYAEVAKDLKASVAPVGAAWELALKENPNRVLHQADKSHPTKEGTYLAACVFYGAIHGKSPEGLSGAPGGLKDEEARKLQALAWKAVQSGQ